MNLEELRDLPGADLILDGVAKLHRLEETENSLLVAIGATRLRAAGLPVPVITNVSELPEHRLYRWLAERYGEDAHSRYNALVRKLISFERTLELRTSAVDSTFPTPKVGQ